MSVFCVAHTGCTHVQIFMGLNARKGQKNSGRAPTGNARKTNPPKAAGIKKKLARVRKQLEESNSLVKKKGNKEHPLCIPYRACMMQRLHGSRR